MLEFMSNPEILSFQGHLNRFLCAHKINEEVEDCGPLRCGVSFMHSRLYSCSGENLRNSHYYTIYFNTSYTYRLITFINRYN